jgi:hypothetical protein
MINHFSAGNHVLRKALQLSLKEMAVLCEITRLSWNSKTNGWCIKSRKNTADYLDIPVRSVQEVMNALCNKGYIEYPEDIGISDSRVRCTEFIYEIREMEDVTFIMTDSYGQLHLASSDFFSKIKKINKEYDDALLNKYLSQSEGVRISHGGVRDSHGGGANFAYNKVHIKSNNKDICQNSDFDNSLSQGSIAESDMSLSNNESIQSNAIGSSMGVCKENVRKQIVSAPYARIGVSKERHNELKEMFEAFRVEYRKSNGSVMGLDKEFENLKKCHPKTWHEVVPTLLDKLKDQNEQRKAQREEQKFTPELPMLSRYVKEQMWDRHYYTSTKQSEPKKTIANFTPDQLT